ncbi:plasmid mobilization relaxosome protein MobC [Ruminococcus sp.]|uniref:plasmid mobilization protein n=1 Tax=Ruminococcus sp. TaxID=41978 RepID=UPI0025FD6E1C|nr:plasmid mobilization relaxosome protein MobC [Ruminococcus sp.]MCR4638362.1 MobC family plasmid mobilization relaxosome protein [Ruminococcus sp.]
MTKIKTERMELRLTPEEKDNLIKRAAEARMSMSKYLLALSEQKKIIVVEDLSEFIRQLIKIGTNVNQVALVANTYRSVSEKQIKTLNENLIQVQQLIRKLIYIIRNTNDEIKV